MFSTYWIFFFFICLFGVRLLELGSGCGLFVGNFQSVFFFWVGYEFYGDLNLDFRCYGVLVDRAGKGYGCLDGFGWHENWDFF